MIIWITKCPNTPKELLIFQRIIDFLLIFVYNTIANDFSQVVQLWLI